LQAWCVPLRRARWHLATLPGPRADSSSEVLFRKDSGATHPSVAAALAAARKEAAENDKIVVFGSFLTVADAYG
jgi:dihydrofolate synthase/folylpolyglutamate synthase